MEVRLLFYIEERVMKIQLLKKLMIMSVLILSSASTVAYAVAAGPAGPAGAKGTTGAVGPAGAKGTTGAVGPAGSLGASGAVLNAFADDVQDALDVGPTVTQECNSNPWISGSTPCPAIQSTCPKGVPVKSNVTCTSLPYKNEDWIKSIMLSINPYWGSWYTDSSIPESTLVDTTQKCSAPGDSAGNRGYTPWCFYKLGGSSYGLPNTWDDSQSPLISVGNPWDSTNNSYVTVGEVSDPNNWQCFPITIQVEAHCVVIPTQMKSVLGRFGIKVK